MVEPPKSQYPQKNPGQFFDRALQCCKQIQCLKLDHAAVMNVPIPCLTPPRIS